MAVIGVRSTEISLDQEVRAALESLLITLYGSVQGFFDVELHVSKLTNNVSVIIGSP
jgi:hypothetical protein